MPRRIRRRVPRRPRVAALLTALAVAAAGLTVAKPTAAAATPVEIDPGVQYQTIRGWGTSLAWWAEGAGGWRNADQRNRLADALFDRDRGLGLNVVRYDIGGYGPGETCSADFRTGGAVPTFAPAPGEWRPDADPTQVRMLRAAVDRLAPGGTLYFSNNFRRFRLDADAIAQFAACEDVSAATLPSDFARNPRIHRTWRLTRLA